MIERCFQVGLGCEIDTQFRLHLPDGRILKPCERILYPDMRIGIVDNNRLNPRRLLLIEKDKRPIQVMIPETADTVSLPYPGKSGFLVLETEISRSHVHSVVKELLNGKPNRLDHLHVATVEGIESVGWQVWWAPLQMSGYLLHVRLIPNSSFLNGEISLINAEALAGVFCKEC